jgi:hypothetical protein
MSERLIEVPDLEKAEHLAIIIGMSCRGPLGFLFMWINIFNFIWATKKAPGCTHILPGIASPFSIFLVSYWESPRDVQRFVRSPAHLRWMRFIYKYPRSLNLFNETYSRPQRANYINRARGYAGSLVNSQRGRQS